MLSSPWEAFTFNEVHLFFPQKCQQQGGLKYRLIFLVSDKNQNLLGKRDLGCMLHVSFKGERMHICGDEEETKEEEDEESEDVVERERNS